MLDFRFNYLLSLSRVWLCDTVEWTHRDRTQVSCIAGRRFNLWATREAPIFYPVEANEKLYKFYRHKGNMINWITF